MKRGKKGIYCLETGEWFTTLKCKNSVEPVLQLLQDSPLSVPYIHRDIATKEELLYYIRKWIQVKHKDYPILYLAFHGSPGYIHLSGRSKGLSTDDLFNELTGKCHRRVIHFGSCKVLDLHGHTINKYLHHSGAAAISGFARDISWVESTIFDTLFFSELQENQFTKPGLCAVRNRLMKIASDLSKALQFKIIIRQ